MKVEFIGVGESCDSNHGNTSIFITTPQTTLLLDCGFSVPHEFFRHHDNPDEPEFIWISHFHGDHFFGLPLLFIRLMEMKRKKDITILGSEDIAVKTLAALELAFPTIIDKLGYRINFKPIAPNKTIKIKGMRLQSVSTSHSQGNQGLKIICDGKKIYYSGDGKATDEAIKLMGDCDLIIHEAFSLTEDFYKHGSVACCLQNFQDSNSKQLALVHMQRNARVCFEQKFTKTRKEHPGLLLPKSGDIINLQNIVMKDIPLNERIIFALDAPSVKEAKNLVKQLDDKIRFFKVGMELFFGAGWDIVDYITERGNKVMLDLKLHDIPATVTRTMNTFNKHDISLTTVHGYSPVIKAALASGQKNKILAVTVLTSMSRDELSELGEQTDMEKEVVARAEKALALGCHGIVCSAQEGASLRTRFGNDFIMVTPGIRPAGGDKHDQQRVATPAQAIANGADYLVIGRPIRDAKDPMDMVIKIQTEIEQELKKHPSARVTAS